MLTQTEGIIPALESSHGLFAYVKNFAQLFDKDKIIVICLSGRGDKDVNNCFRENRGVKMNRIAKLFMDYRNQNKHPLICFLTAGDPDFDTTARTCL